MTLPAPRDDGEDPQELLGLAQSFVAYKQRFTPSNEILVVVKYKFVEPWMRASYHEVTQELVHTWRILTPGGKFTRYAVSEHLQLVHLNMLTAEDFEGRTMIKKPSRGGRRYFMAPNMVVPWSLTAREVAQALRDNVAHFE